MQRIGSSELNGFRPSKFCPFCTSRPAHHRNSAGFCVASLCPLVVSLLASLSSVTLTLQHLAIKFMLLIRYARYLQINAMNERQYRKYVRWSEKELLDMEKQVLWLQQAKRAILHKV